MDLELRDRVAVVTGASRGIGRAVAESLAREGAKVVLCARGEETLAQTVTALRGWGATVHGVAADVATPEGAAAVMDAAKAHFGAVNILVNNVGGSLGTGAFDKVDAEAFSRVVTQNLMSAVWCSQHAVAWMKANGGGAICHVGSLFGREYGPTAPYVAAKAALMALGKEMGVDLVRYGIRVNTVAPGSILFPGGSWDKRRTQDPDRVKKMLEHELPAGRFGTPEEVADAVTFLCSARASWVTGATLPIDGGQGRAL